MRRAQVALAAAMASILMACGGGTSASSAPTPPSSATPTALPAASQVTATPGSGGVPDASPGVGVGEPRGTAVVMLDDERYEFNVGYEFDWGEGVGQCQTMNGWFYAHGPAADDSGLGLVLMLPPQEVQGWDWEAEPAGPPGVGGAIGPPQFMLVSLETLAPEWDERSVTMSLEEFDAFRPYIGLTDAWQIDGLDASGTADVVRMSTVPEDFIFARGTFEVSCD